MKICLTISGEPREYKNTYYSIVEFCKKYNIDIFIHSWEDYTKPGTNDGPGQLIKKEENLKESLISAYNPVWIKTEEKKECINYLQQHYIPHIPVDYERYINTNYASICQWYSTQEATKLKINYEIKNNFKYDIQIKTRFDTFFVDSPDFTNWYIPSITNKNTDLFVGWMNMNNGIMMMEYSTIIGSNQSQDKLWENIIQGITAVGNYGHINPHEQILKYCSLLKFSMKEGTYITQLARNIVRPNIDSKKLKESFENNDDYLSNIIIKQAYSSYK